MKEELNADIREILKDMEGREREIIEKYLFELSSVYRVAREVNSCTDLDKCLEILGERISQILSVEIVSIVLKEEELDLFKIKYAKGLDEEIVKDTVIKKEDPPRSIIHWVIKTGKPLLIDDLSRDGRFPLRKGRYYNHSLLSVPLKGKEEVMGVINVNNKTSHEPFNIDDLSLLTKLADLMRRIFGINAREEEKEDFRHG